MGPGANAQTDKMILAEAHPEIYFWDQPKQPASAGAFAKLLDAAEKEARILVQANAGRPIKAIAHSFGGHLFHQLTLRDPTLFSSCKLYSTGYDIPYGFFRLLKKMSHEASTPSELAKNIELFLKTHPEAKVQDVWDYIGLIAQDPAFYRHYWPTENLFNAFVAKASLTEPMDMASFQNILNDFLTHYFHPQNLVVSPWKGPVTIEFGDKDPLIDIKKESELWSSIFPQASVVVLKNAGHFVHLEKYLKA